MAWRPADNLGVRMLLGDISLMTGDIQNAMKSYFKQAADSPAHWYQAGQIAFREGDFVSACTAVPMEYRMSTQHSVHSPQHYFGMPATAVGRSGRPTT